MKILCLQTGGTIDKDYPRTNQGYAFEIDEPAIGRVLMAVNPGFEFEIVSLLKKDSLDISTEDRKRVSEFCQNTDYSKILITHGSDTLVETAKAIGEIKNKTIVLTGAYRPERFSNSDAAFNIGVAIGVLNMATQGTFIAMNGQAFKANECRKNESSGKFERLNN